MISFKISLLISLLLISGAMASNSDPNCLQESPSGGCLVCSDNFEFSISSESCEPTLVLRMSQERRLIVSISVSCSIQYCKSCSSAEICEECESTFSLNNNDCICPTKTVLQNSTCITCNLTGCTNCSQNNVCTNCSSGYDLTNADTCLFCDIANCYQCSSENVCDNCTSGEPNSDGSACIVCSLSNCAVCKNTSVCAGCDDGFQFSNDGNTCVTCNVDGCNKCSTTDNFCAACQDGYQRNTVNGTCFLCSSPCQTCFSNGTCQTCITPLFSSSPDSTGRCFSCNIQGCQICSSENTTLCTECQANYRLDNETNTCQLLCTDLNCKSCDSTGVCTLCNNFYVLEGDTCNQGLDAPSCLKCSSSNDRSCTQCSDGFYETSGECSPCASFCQDCTSSSSCQILKEAGGNTLFNNGTQVAACNSGCQECSSANPENCLTCSKGFSLLNGECISCSFPCASCDTGNSSSCLSCVDGTFLSGTSCLSCDSEAGCNTCSAANQSECTTCAFGLSLANGQCSVQCPDFCEVCSSSTNCTACQDGYGVNGTNLCVPCLSSCKRCSGTLVTTCLLCGNGFVLKNQTCQVCPAQCQTCSISGGSTVCTACNAGYILTRGLTCGLACNSPCATCQTTNADICFSCLAGYDYVSTTFTCLPITTCSGGCKICPFGYILEQGQCNQCSTSCARCESGLPSSCTACKQGKYLTSSGNLCLDCPAGCKTCNNLKECNSCNNGYTFLSVPAKVAQMCSQCQSPCKTCSGVVSQCNSCISGYKLNGWKCMTKFNFEFRMVLNIQFSLFFNQYVSFLQSLRTLCSLSSLEDITLSQLKEGSTDVLGFISVDQNDQSATTTYQAMNDNLNGGSSIDGISILSNKITVNGGNPPDLSTGTNLTLILAITIPIAVVLLVVVGIIIFFAMKRRHSAEDIEVVLKEDNITTRKISKNLEMEEMNHSGVEPI